MKVGIITMPLCSNYGGTLQNWALQQVLKRMGHEPITFRFPTGYQGMSSFHYWTLVFPYQLFKYIARNLLGRKSNKIQTIGSWRSSVQGMERFIKKHINVTEYLPNLSMSDVVKNEVEALVVGSDQIWRPVMYDAEKYYFLGFAENNNILRVAYAPSIALDTWPFNQETTVKLRELIKKFSKVSVREESAVTLIKDNLGVDAQWVLDPTMLLKIDDYLELCKDEPHSNFPFVFAYILDMTDEKRKMAEKTANALGCIVRYLSASEVEVDDSIEKWLAYFRDSLFVITDSYHGTVFSLIFHKQFYCFYNTYRGNARMDSLKTLTGLEERFIQTPIDKDNGEIDYVKVDSLFLPIRNASLSFLESALSVKSR